MFISLLNTNQSIKSAFLCKTLHKVEKLQRVEGSNGGDKRYALRFPPSLRLAEESLHGVLRGFSLVNHPLHISGGWSRLRFVWEARKAWLKSEC